MIPSDELKAYLDGELSSVDAARVREAIETDPSLASELAEMKRLSESLRFHAAKPTAVGLESTLAALERRQRKPFWTNPITFAVPLGLAAVVAGLLMIKPRQSYEEAASASADPGYVAMRSSSADRSEVTSVVKSPSAAAESASVAAPPVRDRSEAQADSKRVATGARVRSQPQLDTDANILRDRGVPTAKVAAKRVRSDRPSGTKAGSHPSKVKAVPGAAIENKQSIATTAAPMEKPDQEILVLHVSSVEEAEQKVRQVGERLGAEFENEIGREFRNAKTEASERKLVLAVDAENEVAVRKEILALQKPEESPKLRREAIRAPSIAAMRDQRTDAATNAKGQSGGGSVAPQGRSGPGQSSGVTATKGGFGGGGFGGLGGAGASAEERSKMAGDAEPRPKKKRIVIVLKPKATGTIKE